MKLISKMSTCENAKKYNKNKNFFKALFELGRGGGKGHTCTMISQFFALTDFPVRY